MPEAIASGRLVLSQASRRCPGTCFYKPFKAQDKAYLRTTATMAYTGGTQLSALGNSESWSIYEYPTLYEAAFTRDYVSEVQFLEDAYAEVTGSQAESFLDLACGPGNHSVQLALKGHRVVALDSSQGLLTFARSKADKEGVDIKFLRKDMEDFELPAEEDQVDVALLLLNTMSELHSNHDARECLLCIHRALKPGGMLIMELPPVGPIFDGSFIEGDHWENPVPGQEGVQIIMEYGTDDDEFDSETQVLRKRIGLSIRKGDDITLVGEQYVWQRIYTYQEISLLADLTNFVLVASYGDLNLKVASDDPDSTRIILCLQKPDEADVDFLDDLTD